MKASKMEWFGIGCSGCCNCNCQKFKSEKETFEIKLNQFFSLKNYNKLIYRYLFSFFKRWVLLYC